MFLNNKNINKLRDLQALHGGEYLKSGNEMLDICIHELMFMNCCVWCECSSI